MNSVRIVARAPDRMDAEVVVGFFFEDQRPVGGAAALLDWRLNGRLSHLLVSGSAAGRIGEYILVGNNGKLQASWVLFAGGGRLQDLTPFTYGGLVGNIVDVCREAGFRKVSLCLTAPDEASADWIETLAGELTFGIGDMNILLTLQEQVGV